MAAVGGAREGTPWLGPGEGAVAARAGRVQEGLGGTGALRRGLEGSKGLRGVLQGVQCLLLRWGLVAPGQEAVSRPRSLQELASQCFW